LNISHHGQHGLRCAFAMHYVLSRSCYVGRYRLGWFRRPAVGKHYIGRRMLSWSVPLGSGNTACLSRYIDSTQ
jgi:hypothetical protein